jgi:hypothetical protein
VVSYNTANGNAPVNAGTYTATGTYAGSQDYTSATGTATISITSATHFVLSGLPASITAGVSINVTVQADDSAGAIVPGYSGTLALRSSDPRAALPANVGFTNGVALFQVSFETAGTESFTVADAANVLPAVQSSVSVNAAAAAALVFTSQPRSTFHWLTLGTVSVQLVDTFGNKVDSSAPVTVALGNDPGNGQLTGTLTVNAVHGVATFSDLRVSEVGSGYTLRASSPGLSAGTSKPFNITGLPTGLTQQAPLPDILLSVLDAWFASSSNLKDLRSDLSIWLGPLN